MPARSPRNAAAAPLQLQLPTHSVSSQPRGEPVKTIPSILKEVSRSATAERDPFINDTVVKVEAVYELASPSRGDMRQISAPTGPDRLLALEAADGTTLFIRADRLHADLKRLYPQQVREGVLDLKVLQDREGASRGLSDWVWSKVSVLLLGSDGLTDIARDKALELAKEKLKAVLSDQMLEYLEHGASWLGAKALMWAIESRLAGEQGLYRWRGQALGSADIIDAPEKKLEEAVKANQPILLFIHGTASSTMGSFGGLAESSNRDWDGLKKQFGEHIYGFEHRTFSESPIENALNLVDSLPAGARLSLVTHSRGGLVGDLLCLGGLTPEQIRQYQRGPSPNSEETAEQKILREQLNALEQEQLRQLAALLERKNFRIERYVRVACPAGGTRLLSDNLDVFLSSLLSLMNLAVGFFTSGLGDTMMSAFKRIVLEIADKRIDPHMVPGIEAMLTDAPMGVLLANASRRQGVKMAVVAGDTQGGSLLKRIAVMFTDWMFFDKVKNDLVVDTRSMYAGLARRADTHALFDRGGEVSHFAYFRNPHTRSALCGWLTSTALEQTPFMPIEGVLEREARERSAISRPAEPSGKRPIVFYLPGIMGSHLEVRKKEQPAGEGNRVWLDFIDLGLGGLDMMSLDQGNVFEESMIDMFYGRLAEFLQDSHDVIRFPYDWRLSIEESADRLIGQVEGVLEKYPRQPVRLLAHSMGGLVARTLIAKKPELWEKIVEREGGRFVMLGTPNNGSHLIVSTLLGKGSTIRKLARLDMRHSMQEVLDIISAYPGVLQLLPRPDFVDADPETHYQYLESGVWSKLKASNQDFWFGDGLGAKPGTKALKIARALWDTWLCEADEQGQLKTRKLPHPERVAYVFGKAEATDCGLRVEGGRLKMRSTEQGDGSVTWASGRLEGLPDDRHWYMPVEHGALANTPMYFPAVRELLETGATLKLEQTAPVSRGGAVIRSYEAGPEPYPSAAELMDSIFGGEPGYREAPDKLPSLSVSVRAMDLRFAQLPVMCGHYVADAISGAEAQIDECIVNGALTQRQRLGVYADEVGTSTVVLNERSEEEKRRGTGKGAVIIGLGDWGKISTPRITEAVCEGVLHFLLHNLNHEQQAKGEPVISLGLSSLLIGYNSTAHISVEASVDAIVRGVCEANQRFTNNMNSQLRVGKLEFIEFYLDTAITAAHAVRELPTRLAKDFQRYQIQVDAAPQLNIQDSVRHRLSVHAPFGYWPRLIVTDADPDEDKSPKKSVERLKYVFLSERARAEAVAQQRQPGLVEALVRESLRDSRYNRDIARTLFQLMVPLDFKVAARQTDRLLIVVDASTANLPWEMLQADDEPLALKVSIIRQLESTRFRKNVTSTVQRTACVIGNPSTAGFYDHFKMESPNLPDKGMPSLTGAAKEAAIIAETLGKSPQRYEVEALYPRQENAQPYHYALEVFNVLFKRSYRILAIAAHGVVDAPHNDGRKRTGVVLSDGILLTAAEIGQMEVVPELVFLNCCHLGAISAGQDGKAAETRGGTSSSGTQPAVSYNRLAYSVARELIEMGVRCVVVAGWAVNDQAASVFAESFFTAFINEQRPFGEAIFQARRAAYEQRPDSNTWGAYQAYGDPGYVLDADSSSPATARRWQPVAQPELIERLDGLRSDTSHAGHKRFTEVYAQAQELLQQAPVQWQELSAVQFALGRLYGECGDEGFEQARAAYQRAIAGEDCGSQVPVTAVEQLANLEARTGEAKGGAEGYALINSAINRMTSLLEVTDGVTAETTDGIKRICGLVRGDAARNAERWSLLGSAWKRKAVLHQRSSATWEQIEGALQHSRDAYKNAEGFIDGPNCSLYAMLNRLQLDGLLLAGDEKTAEERKAALQLARRCQDMARQRFVESYDFFDAVMSADAQLTIHLLDGTLNTLPEEALVKTYQDAARSVPASNRKFDSVTRQLVLLADLLDLRQRAGDGECVRILREVAGRLQQG